MWTVLGIPCLRPGGRGRPAWPTLTCGTADRERCSLCIRLRLALAGSPVSCLLWGRGANQGGSGFSRAIRCQGRVGPAGLWQPPRL